MVVKLMLQKLDLTLLDTFYYLFYLNCESAAVDISILNLMIYVTEAVPSWNPDNTE